MMALPFLLFARPLFLFKIYNRFKLLQKIFDFVTLGTGGRRLKFSRPRPSIKLISPNQFFLPIIFLFQGRSKITTPSENSLPTRLTSDLPSLPRKKIFSGKPFAKSHRYKKRAKLKIVRYFS